MAAAAAAAAFRVAEEQMAAKAAAKKAKKLRQKLKAKEQASASVAEPHGACIPSDEAQPFSPESSQLSMDSSESSPSANKHQAENLQVQNLEPGQQQLDKAKGSSLSVSASVGATAARENDAVDVSVELEAMHLSSSGKAANKGQTDADFLQQLFCCPLTKVSHSVAVHAAQACICSVSSKCDALVIAYLNLTSSSSGTA